MPASRWNETPPLRQSPRPPRSPASFSPFSDTTPETASPATRLSLPGRVGTPAEKGVSHADRCVPAGVTVPDGLRSPGLGRGAESAHPLRPASRATANHRCRTAGRVARGRGVGVRHVMGERSPVAEHRPAGWGQLRVVDAARGDVGRHVQDRDRLPGHQQHVPAPVHPGQDGGYGGSSQQRPARLRHRRGLVRARARSLRRGIFDHARAGETARRSAAGHHEIVGSRPDRLVRRTLLHAG